MMRTTNLTGSGIGNANASRYGVKTASRGRKVIPMKFNATRNDSKPGRTFFLTLRYNDFFP